MDPETPLPSDFLPAERAPERVIQRLRAQLEGQPVARAMMEAFAGHVFILDEHRQVVAANTEALAAFGDLLGHRPGELLGCIHSRETEGGCGTTAHCRECGSALAILASQTEGVPVSRECLLTARRGLETTSSEYRVRATPLEVGGQTYTVFVIQDISAAKRKEVLEHLLWTHMKDLVQEVRQEAAGEVGISGNMALDVMTFASQLSEEMLAWQLLAQAEQGTLPVRSRPFEVRALFDELGEAFVRNPMSSGRRLELIPATDAVLNTDPVLLAQVLLPMIHNALEASRPQDVVKVWLSVREGHPVLNVSNPSLVPRQVAGRIFQRSFSTKAVTGRGMGTYTMRLLAERYLDARVGFTSRVGEGTIFFIELPIGSLSASEVTLGARVEAASLPAPLPPRHEGLGGRILVVDDSRTILSIFSKVLGEEHQIITATKGEDALRIAREWLPDLILLDVVMPGMDGYEVCGKLKADPLLGEIPVIFLSSMNSEADEAVGLALGAIDYLAKPISPAIVTMRVRNHITLKRYRDLLEARSYEDGLTGIANRRRFDEVLSREWARAQRQREPLSLVLGDVDHFKRYNDGYGHLEGDACLKDVAQAMAASLQRSTDLAARYGGEEFALVLPCTEEAGARKVAARVLEAVRELRRPHAHSPVADHVTLSLGLATCIPDPGMLCEDLVALADRALYQAKESGRDRYCLLGHDGKFHA